MNQFTDGRHEWITEYDETASAGWNEWSSKHDGRIKQIVEALIDSTNFRLKHFFIIQHLEIFSLQVQCLQQ